MTDKPQNKKMRTSADFKSDWVKDATNALLVAKIEILKDQIRALLKELDLMFYELSMGDRDIRLKEEVRRFEIDLIRLALRRARGSQTQAARFLNIKLTTLNAKVKASGIPRDY